MVGMAAASCACNEVGTAATRAASSSGVQARRRQAMICSSIAWASFCRCGRFVCPRPGMSLGVAVLEPMGGHMGVNLGGRQAAMSEQLLHAADVGAMIE